MPCPYFEPLTPVLHRTHSCARLPLIEEYDGLCHADGTALPAPADARFRCCNHGYSRGICVRLPDGGRCSAMRYNVLSHSEATLEVLCVEETDHAPGRFFTLTYDALSGTLRSATSDAVTEAQVAAFCRSYLKQYAAGGSR